MIILDASKKWSLIVKQSAFRRKRLICPPLAYVATMGHCPGNRHASMNLIRLLILGLIVWLLYRMVQRLLNKPRPVQQGRRKAVSTDMVRCAHCGIHIPENEALVRDGRHYCSEAHRASGPSD